MRRLTAFKMLLHDRSTTAGSLLGVIAIVFLVGQQLSVLFGLFTFMSVLPDHSGADIWICSENTDNVNATGSIPIRYVDRISGLSGVEWVEPVVFGSGTFRRADGQFQVVQVVGVRPPRFILGPWRFHEGSLDVLFDYDGITVDRLDLKILGYPERHQLYEINNKRVRVNGITQSLANELGWRNIRINAIAPGPTDTTALARNAGDYAQEMIKSMPIKRLGQPRDMADAALFLLSDEASWITGHILNVDGGQFMRP